MSDEQQMSHNHQFSDRQQMSHNQQFSDKVFKKNCEGSGVGATL